MWFNVLIFLLGFLAFIYYFLVKNYGMFERMGVREHKPRVPESLLLFAGKKGFTSIADDMYWAYKGEKMVGYHGFGGPALLVRDLELAKKVLVKDFDYFVDRRKFFPVDPNDRSDSGPTKYFANMLTMLDGDQWRQVRHMVSPVFTSGKLKGMNPTMNKIADEFVEFLKLYAESGKDFDAKEAMVRLTLDVICECGFGVRGNGIAEENGIFRKMVSKMAGAGDPMAILRFLFSVSFPDLAARWKITSVNQEGATFVINAIQQSMRERRGNNVRRNDLVDLLLDATKGVGDQQDESELSAFEKDAAIKITKKMAIPEEDMELVLISSAFLLFFAGFDTTSTVLAICMHYLAIEQDCQETLYHEVQEALNNTNDGVIDYNTIQSLLYLDSFVHEVTRIYGIIPLERVCVREYKVPGTNVTIPKGTVVQVAVNGIMKDSKYYPDPLVFNPERFGPDAKANRNPYTYLPFGQGPRNCLGMRFALLQMKIALAKVLSKYRVVPCEKTVKGNLEIDPTSPQSMPKGGVWVKVETR